MSPTYFLRGFTPGWREALKNQTLQKLHNLHPWTMPGFVVLGIIASLAEGLSIGMLVPILQSVLDSAPVDHEGPLAFWMREYSELFAEGARVPVLAASIFCLILLKSIATYSYTRMGEWLAASVAHDLRMRLVRQFLDVEYTYLLRQRAGRLIDTLQNQTWRAGEVFSWLGEMWVTGSTVAVFATLLLLTSWQVTLGVAVGAVLAGAMIHIISKRARRLGEQAVSASQALVARMVDLLGGMRMTRAYGQENREHEEFRVLSEGEKNSYFAMNLSSIMVRPVMELLYVPLLLIALAVAWKAGISEPVLMVCLVLFYRMLPQIQSFYKARVKLASLLGGVEDIDALLRADDKPFLASGTRQFKSLRQGIEFENVGFSYAPRRSPDDEVVTPRVNVDISERETLRGLNFTIPQGQMVAIVGGSGAGKSTIVNLLCRLFDPNEGRILVDGIPLTDLDVKSWRLQTAITGQDADLVSGTIAENIAYGRPEATQENIEIAAHRAEAHEFIVGLREGYETNIGDRGRLLSEGQRQRVSLARALLTNPSILILDEGTSALDNVTAAAIDRTLDALRGQLTIVAIAHRLESIRSADHILVLERGVVVEEGSWTTLASSNGPFARLQSSETSKGVGKESHSA
ncbi:MAG: subfamily B ATP-binding cassette protein MsbA [Planctomycetota bacterium]